VKHADSSSPCPSHRPPSFAAPLSHRDGSANIVKFNVECAQVKKAFREACQAEMVKAGPLAVQCSECKLEVLAMVARCAAFAPRPQSKALTEECSEGEVTETMPPALPVEASPHPIGGYAFTRKPRVSSYFPGVLNPAPATLTGAASGPLDFTSW
jgi:hypothetical protein